MSSATLEPGAYYIPTIQAWDRYKNNGGSAEFRARTVSTQQDNLVQLSGLPSYWWKVSELSVGIAYEVPAKIEIPTPKPSPSRPTLVIEVPTQRLQTTVYVGDLNIEYESEEDEDCEGEDCSECSGDGCTSVRESLSARSLLDHLLEDYSHSAASYAEEFGMEASDVDIMYRDLLVLVGAIKVRG